MEIAKTTQRQARVFAALVLSFLLVPLTLAGPASAAPKGSEVTVSTAPDPVCEAARKKTHQKGKCKAEHKQSVSPAAKISSNDLTRDGDLVSQDGTKLSAAAARATIWTKTWWQERRGLYYINWWEKHSGRVYFNGTRVWSTKSNYGYKGRHACNQGGGIGYSVKVTSCSTEVRHDLGKYAISEWDRFQVHVVARGIPIYASHSMHTNIYADGGVRFH